ncbi:dTDP-glucose 4,6-dehydratase [Muriicola soli]|uniref:dTDP-glucose 4,6-dehydratase n=1 Tax=Muriicola soli TaxID=2507538 RepID=A0A411ECD4_9FLAO|nr:dTDP-glucose 4,6-dehydratase [Muriicola soli]QBA65392.1 dTDP-glucose 4,6-dehydratase [Muriicola soli]
MSKKGILITGGAGFIGSNFIPYLLNKYPDYHIINLDKLTYAGDLSNLKEVEDLQQYEFIQGDICDEQLVGDVFKQHSISSVIHFAAESHVDNSIHSPNSFIKTNIEGTFVLLEAARKYWSNSRYPNQRNRFHHISTDEVYGSLGETGLFSENSPYAPNSPYSASKAASDLLVRSYHKTYGLDTVISNCSNNYGPKQHDEKLIPTVIRKAIEDKPIPIYGDGSNVRDWIYVLDHCKALDLVFHKGQTGESYVIGGNNEYANLYLAKTICELLDQLSPKEKGSYTDQISFVKDRLGHDFRYGLDISKMNRTLAWNPEEDFIGGLTKTVKWYLRKYEKA